MRGLLFLLLLASSFSHLSAKTALPTLSELEMRQDNIMKTQENLIKVSENLIQKSTMLESSLNSIEMKKWVYGAIGMSIGLTIGILITKAI